MLLLSNFIKSIAVNCSFRDNLTYLVVPFIFWRWYTILTVFDQVSAIFSGNIYFAGDGA